MSMYVHFSIVIKQVLKGWGTTYRCVVEQARVPGGDELLLCRILDFGFGFWVLRFGLFECFEGS